jgi:hypothetical protein
MLAGVLVDVDIRSSLSILLIALMDRIDLAVCLLTLLVRID